MGSEASECRQVLFCVGSRAEENAALWQWASQQFLEHERDVLTFVFARTDNETTLGLTGGLQTHRALHSDLSGMPAWLPPALVEALATTAAARSVEFVEIVSDLSPGDAILQWLAEQPANLQPNVVLLGSRGMTGVRRFLLGSVAGFILEQGSWPCLVVRSSLPKAGDGATQAQAADRPEGRSVAVAVDGGEMGLALVSWARSFLLRPSDRVTVLHGRPAREHTDDELAAIDRAIEAVQTTTAAIRELNSEQRVRPGTATSALLAEGEDVRDALCDWAETHRPDVLLVGSRGIHSALKRLALGSVSSYCVQHAPCPVLVVSAEVLKARAQDLAMERAADAAVGSTAAVK